MFLCFMSLCPDYLKNIVYGSSVINFSFHAYCMHVILNIGLSFVNLRNEALDKRRNIALPQ